MSRQFPAAPPAPSTPLVPVGNPAPSQTLLDRTGRWIEQNRNLLILGATVAVSAGAGYYLYNRSSSGGSGPSSGSDGASTSSAKKNKKKNKKKSKFIPGDGASGPLLEEIQPAPAAQNPEVKKEASEEPQAKDILETIPEGAALAAMSEAERNQLGAKLKDKGNTYYQSKQFQKAVECYTKAIEVSVKRDAVFFSNRAACYTNYSPPEYEKVVEDCDEALKLDRTYAKALKRRAAALERLERYEEALRDYTATTIIESFKDQKANEAMDRCLKNLVAKKHEELVKTREPSLPSYGFISQYLSAFRPHVKPTLPENPSQGDQTLNLAFDALAAGDYTHALSFTNEAIEQGLSSNELKAEALNLRGTFKFLTSDPKGALEDLEKSIDASPTSQAWVKLAAVHIELDDKAKAFGDFESALQLNPNDPDIYYHRGQIYFLVEEFANAQTDYEKSTELDDTFIFSHIQHAMCQYKLGNVGASTASFRRILRQFPDRSEGYNYYGEILLDTKKFPEAIERFDRALEIDKDKNPPNVLPMVNKAYAMVHWQQDFDAAEKLCKEAFERDPGCDTAAATLAQVSLTKSKIDDAIYWFEKHLKIARSDMEIINTIQYLEASKAQKEFMVTYPEYAARLSQIAQTVQ